MHQNPQFFWNLFALTTELLKETIISGAIYQGPQPMGKWGGGGGGGGGGRQSGHGPSNFLESYVYYGGFPRNLLLCHCVRHLRYCWPPTSIISLRILHMDAVKS